MERPSTSPCETLAERYQALLEVAESISRHRDLRELCRDLAQRLPRVVQVNFVSLSLHDPARNIMRLHTIQANVPADLIGGHEQPVEDTPSGVVWQTQQPILVPEVKEERRWPGVLERMKEDGVRSFCVVPLTTAVRRLGAIGFSSLQNQAYGEADLEFLGQVGKQLGVAVDNVLHQQDLAHDRDRLRMLLEVSESIASYGDLEQLFQDLAQRLPKIVPFDYINAVLHDESLNVMRLWLLVTAEPSTISPGLELPVDESPGGLVWKTQESLTVNDVAQERRFPKLMALLRDNGVASFCVVPLTTAQRKLGAMGFGSLHPKTYDEAEIDFMRQVAKQIAVAVDNALNSKAALAYQRQLALERDRQRLLLEVNNAVVSHLELRELLKAISTCLRRVMPHDLAGFALYDPGTGQLLTHALDFPRNQDFIEAGVAIPLEGTPEGRAFTSRQAVRIKHLSLSEFPAEIIKRAELEGLKSGCAVPLISHGRVLGTLSVVSLRDDAFSTDDAELLTQIGAQVAIAVENGLAYREIADLKDKLGKEKLYLEDEIRTEYNFEEIIGESTALKKVLKQVEVVAPTDSTVLILGETGTGKELLARAIHNLSGRRERTFVKMNCAAIPTGLLESELFGHEKGAFTGAIATKIGRFELAHQGTIFLDEVGEIPLDLQVKLLRVLQEQEFERLGSTRTIRVNVRVVAATNRDLSRMVEEGAFRNDLYYRLNVFPLTVPPLRDRIGDIPPLVRHFAQKFALRMGKGIETIPSEAIRALEAYPWPGNVRELENFIERAVILSQGSVLHVSLAELRPRGGGKVQPAATLEAAEREHILRILRETGWVIGGASGAATRLGMKRTTLQSKMQKLGIARPS
ncbi:HyfR-type DNA-binding transcriptional activator [Nitrospira sp. KM1]|uniref:sigma 54-interacting transcriptional regulator n=1 Tax=Nitrospira sp. KM1 TaxID=1936990 RepID=UPI0013A72ADA|nr:sigma 54-interacting transcriptional regulator [Nitrospira sp. KM1]BCA55265.1 HyfR-type DNA-binding transcriptional activator [Nitrospira sp. KM1]